MQSRVGPDRAGPFGILQTLADAIKLLLKEQIMPLKADRAMYILAPILALVPSFLIFNDEKLVRIIGAQPIEKFDDAIEQMN